MDTARRPTLAVIGGGIIGRICALAAADAGWQVDVYDAGPTRRAAQVAGGMLGALGEGHPGEGRLLDRSAASSAMWPDWIDRLGDPGIRTAEDSLIVATTAADGEYLRQMAQFVWSEQVGGDRLRPLRAREARALERSLSTRVHSGYLAVGEGALDNRRLLAALRIALVDAGAHWHRIAITALSDVTADQVLVAAGMATPRLLPEIALVPAKGEILRLHRNRESVPVPTRVVRARVEGRDVYLVPRADGVVVGATQYEPSALDDHAPRAGGVADLLADAVEIMPGLATYDLAEAAAGIRPCSADGLPIIERVDARTVVAAGHGRNGIVLAPDTAARVVRLLAG
ncbi:glycine oxidase ThiO [Gordonia sp. X0973]|uniref:glycine oxidase ThiO n=1 Tax=Gordonia sp. X0973 TaxID=2742602 RepID=UPI000F52A0CD|nr:glycine oxidase ThiO [Gordonia sp. X0973]QKT08997.1 glycine oxidase ThiO [Gordonia sp. X0973]